VTSHQSSHGFGGVRVDQQDAQTVELSIFTDGEMSFTSGTIFGIHRSGPIGLFCRIRTLPGMILCSN
jgi:hypothetical protein